MDNDIYGTAKKITIKEEDDFAGRRLLVYDVKQTGKKDVKDVLETLPDNSKSYLEVERVYEQTQENVDDKWRFIPNTGEYLMMEVRYKLVNKNDVNLLLLNEYKLEAEVLAKDRAYDETVSNGQDNGNIYKNKTNQFEIGLHKGIKSLPVISYKIYRQEKEEDKKYYAPKKEDVKRISIEKNGRLINSQKEKIKMGIRPISSEQAFPGDDLIIGLKIYDKGTEESSIIWSKEKDYIAVYDKKMLWRANLYIDEGKTDWNKKHPWNVPVNGSSGGPVWWDGDGSQTAAQRWGNNKWNTANGEQIKIVSCTYWDGNKKIEKSVAYGWGCRDDLTKYNNYLKKESDLIKKGRDELNQNQNEGNNNSQNINVLQNLSSDSAFNTLTWNESTVSTYAPSDKWENYLFTKRTKKTTSDNKTYYKYGTSTATDTQHKYYIDGQTHVPGLSTYWAYGPEEEIDYEPAQATNHYSIGTDCSGLVESAIDYGNFYKANSTTNKESENKLGCAGLKSSSFEIRAAGEWKIEQPDSSVENKEEERILLSHVVPGDIFVKPSSPGAHIVIIQNLNYSGEDCTINDLSDIDIIQAGKGENADWQVMKGNFKTADYGDHTLNTFELRRLNVK